MPENPHVLITIRAVAISHERAIDFIDSFNEWAGDDSVASLLVLTGTDTPSGCPETDYTITTTQSPR